MKQVLVGFDATLRRRDVGARAEGALMRKVSGGVDPVLRASGGASPITPHISPEINGRDSFPASDELDLKITHAPISGQGPSS